MTYVPKILSGIDVIDNSWGGMYEGGTYMCCGRASSGRGLLGMLFLQMGVVLEEKAMFLSPGQPQDWMIQAASVNFDMAEAKRNNQLRLVWIPSPAPQQSLSDVAASRAIEDLVGLIVAEQPARLLINDFMPFLQFRSFDRFRQMFTWMTGQLSQVGTTVLLLMPESINTQSKHIVEFMSNHMSGTMHIALQPEGPSDNSRRLALLPGLGHVKHEVFDHWEIPLVTLAGRHIAASPENSQSATKKRSRRKGRSAAAHTPFEKTTPDVFAKEFAQLDASMPSVAIESLQEVRVLHEAFYNKLTRSFKQRASKKYKPFLLVALRIESAQTALDAPIGLDMLLPAIENIVQHEEDMLVDLGRQRVIAFLPNTQGDGVQAFFESIQLKLREKYPDIAEQLPHIVSAVVVPNGQPFEKPEDFLAYALEGN